MMMEKLTTNTVQAHWLVSPTRRGGGCSSLLFYLWANFCKLSLTKISKSIIKWPFDNAWTWFYFKYQNNYRDFKKHQPNLPSGSVQIEKNTNPRTYLPARPFRCLDEALLIHTGCKQEMFNSVSYVYGKINKSKTNRQAWWGPTYCFVHWTFKQYQLVKDYSNYKDITLKDIQGVRSKKMTVRRHRHWNRYHWIEE